MRYRLVHKLAVAGSLAGGSALAVASLNNDRHHLVREVLLSSQRALHAAACASAVALRYKTLSWRHGKESPEIYGELLSQTHEDCAKLALQMCRSNGGLFVKIGQHAATLAPAVPPEYVQHLSLLQDRAPAAPLEDVRVVICSEIQPHAETEILGPESIFTEFDAEPVGSASLAQVHRAKLHDGSEVAVKVQHRDIEAIVASDVFIVRCLEKLMSLVFRQEGFSMAWAIDEFERNVKHELDFREEALHAERSRELFQHYRSHLAVSISIPKVYQQLSTRRVLVMSFSHGTAITNLVKAAKKRAKGSPLSSDEEKAASAAVEARRLLVEAFGAMVFVFGYVHCDPHPGNILVEMERSSSTRLVILDHGLYRELSEERRLANCRLWKAMALQESNELKKHCGTLGIDSSTAELLPLYFTNRSLETKAGLGQKITAKQKEELKMKLQSLGILPQKASAASFAVSGLGMLADRVPGDMLMVMRTMHLVASLHRDLGGNAVDRFSCYSLAAARGSASEAGAPAWRLHQVFVFVKTWAFKARLWLRELRLRLHESTMGQAQEEFSIARSLAEIASNSQ